MQEKFSRITNVDFNVIGKLENVFSISVRFWWKVGINTTNK
jgi:hypothetical protein